jgi:hypothetical protein
MEGFGYAAADTRAFSLPRRLMPRQSAVAAAYPHCMTRATMKAQYKPIFRATRPKATSIGLIATPGENENEPATVPGPLRQAMQ